MFDDVREALRDLLHGNSTPDERRAAVSAMKETLVLARMGLDDLRKSIEVTRVRLTAERRELETMVRRKTLAAGINDAETLALAERYERQHAEKVTVLERKLESQEAELALTEREVQEMGAELKAAAAGVGSGLGATPATDSSLDPGGDAERLRSELDAMARSRHRSATEADADERLAALKRRMGK